MGKLKLACGTFYVCDCCESEDGRPTLVWKQLPGRRGHFAICHNCLRNLYIDHIAESDKEHESLRVRRKAISEARRDEIFERDDHSCKMCGAKQDLVVDHIIPFSRGGGTKMKNLQTLCRSCNSQKRANIISL